MSDMISVAGNFQYSVNIAYDIQNTEKLKGFIPTKSSLELLESVLLSVQKNSSKRARILIGAYGKGKSHIVLTILSILRRHEPLSDFVHLNRKIKEYPRIESLVKNYYDSGKKLLPVLITGSGTSLSQSFLLALNNALKDNNLSDIMPKTNYQAAANVILKWKKEYKSTLKNFEKVVEIGADDFIAKLNGFDANAYRQFECVYPELTAGSQFNPFLGFDVVELYESVAKELRRKELYDGLYVVYDEFSKYLESNIESASVSDTKMLQDFAEKACRSGEAQLHFMLISHKEIANYIDKLPKQKTDGWRGISERFEHVLLNNNFSQVYEIISTVIQKDKKKWQAFKIKNKERFLALENNYKKSGLFSGVKVDGADSLFEQLFPLHPVSAFILPRLSERIAQNERTLFTFLSAEGAATLFAFLKKHGGDDFCLVTPDLIFDYFEPLFKKEIYNGELHDIYRLASVILDKLESSDFNLVDLERRIVKTICLIYILGQFEKLKPLSDEIINIYDCSYSSEQVKAAISNLIQNEFVIYLRQSNSYLKLKETSGVDIAKSVRNEIERQKVSFALSAVLNKNNNERYFYPYKYNDEKEMTRFFELRFVDFAETFENEGLEEIDKESFSDGKVFAVICKNKDETDIAAKSLLKFTKDKNRFVFALLKKAEKIEKAVRELSALMELCERAAGDEILCSEYQVVYEDVSQIVDEYIKKYTHPEIACCRYFYNGKEKVINRRTGLTSLFSDICSDVFPYSPVINNEAINKDKITQVAINSRRKILAGLLRRPLEKNLGLAGNGQDVAIMRSTLLHVGVLEQKGNSDVDFARLNLSFKSDKYNLNSMLKEISNFANKATGKKRRLSDLYQKLVSPEFKIGMRRGVIPIYIAAVFGQIKKQLVLYYGERQVPINADSLSLLNDRPEEFSLLRFVMDDDKELYLQELRKTFCAKSDSAEDVFAAIQGWFLALPKYSRESQSNNAKFIKAVTEASGAQELLFTVLPSVIGAKNCDQNCASQIAVVKCFYDNCLFELKNELADEVKKMFGSDLRAWLKKLSPQSLDYLYPDGAERLLALIKNGFENEISLVESLALAATGLRLEDWTQEIKAQFFERLKNWKSSAESFSNKGGKSDGTFEGGELSEKSYAISFVGKSGKVVTRKFDKVDDSPRSRLLFNKLTDALETMGRSMSEAEKRQTLMEVLKTVCGGEA